MFIFYFKSRNDIVIPEFSHRFICIYHLGADLTRLKFPGADLTGVLFPRGPI